MFTRWKCHNCELINNDGKDTCQACFNLPTELSPLKSINLKQDLLFDGYFQFHISSHNQPMDIMDLCSKFYKVPVKISSHRRTTKRQALEIISIAKKFWENHEYFMSFELYKLLQTYHKDEKFQHKMSMILILQSWKQYEYAEICCKEAIETATIDKGKYIHRYGSIL